MPGTLTSFLTAQIPFPLAAAVEPWLIYLLAVLAAAATILLLPGNKKKVWTRLGGAMLLAAGGLGLAALVRWTAGSPGGAGGVSYVYFWIFAVIALFATVRVITHAQPVYSALYFVLTVFATAGLFVLLWAEFMAAALVLIYAGAILVTYVFVIMLAAEASPARETNESGARASVLAEHDRLSREPVLASVVGFAVLAVLLVVILDRSPGSIARAPWSPPLATRSIPAEERFVMAHEVPVAGVAADAPRPIVSGGSQELGFYLFTEHMVALQLAGLLLTISMVGAIVIARKKIVLPPSAVAATPEVMHSPATPTDDNPHSIPVAGTTDPAAKVYPEN